MAVTLKKAASKTPGSSVRKWPPPTFDYAISQPGWRLSSQCKLIRHTVPLRPGSGWKKAPLSNLLFGMGCQTSRCSVHTCHSPSGVDAAPGSRQLNPTIAMGIVSSFMLAETDLDTIGYVKQVPGQYADGLGGCEWHKDCME